MIKERRVKRRNIKNELSVVEIIISKKLSESATTEIVKVIERMDNRAYEPRVLKELFNLWGEMMICERCNVMMKSGTRYENREGKNNRKRFDECPVCHDRKYNKVADFQDFVVKESNKISKPVI